MVINWHKFRVGIRRIFILFRRVEWIWMGATFILLTFPIPKYITIPFLVLLGISKFLGVTLQEFDEELTNIIYKKELCLPHTLKIIGIISAQVIIAIGCIVDGSKIWGKFPFPLPSFVIPIIFIVGFTIFLVVKLASTIAALWNNTGDDRSSFLESIALATGLVASILWLISGHLHGTSMILMFISGISFCFIGLMKFERKSVKIEELEKFRVNNFDIKFTMPPIINARNMHEAVKEFHNLLNDENEYRAAPFFGYPWEDKHRNPLHMRHRHNGGSSDEDNCEEERTAPLLNEVIENEDPSILGDNSASPVY